MENFEVGIILAIQAPKQVLITTIFEYVHASRNYTHHLLISFSIEVIGVIQEKVF